MSKNSFFTCDYCLKNTAEMFEMPEAWLMAGTWTQRSNWTVLRFTCHLMPKKKRTRINCGTSALLTVF